MKVFIIIMLSIVTTGCVRHASTSSLEAGAEKIKVYRKSDPPSTCVEIRPFSATNGNGCGLLGSMGSFEGAYNTLRNTVIQMGGNAVLIENELPPHAAPGCYVNTYLINAVAYKCSTTP